jgi:hypothetical protein
MPTVDAGSDGTLADVGADTSSANDVSSPDTSTQDSATDAADDSSETGGDAPVDAPADVQLNPDGGAILKDAGPGGDGASLSCGSAQCQLPNETCCVYADPTSSSFFVDCANGAACPALVDAGFDAGNPVALQCESNQNCQGSLLCCLTSNNDGGTIASHCTSSCQGGEEHAVLCDKSLADAGCGDAACASTNIGTWLLPSGFATCGGVSR